MEFVKIKKTNIKWKATMIQAAYFAEAAVVTSYWNLDGISYLYSIQDIGFTIFCYWMFSKKNKKRAFTLIEMLIVIVIIGILAAALIPRLSSARGRANDVARKADLAQTAAALVSYQIDRGSFPTTAWSLSGISNELIGAWMSSIPKDPNSSRPVFLGIAWWVIGQYSYTPITKWWIAGNAFVLMAWSETEWWSNRVVADSSDYFSSVTLFENTTPCTAIIENWTNSNNNAGTCTYNKWDDVLRYIYLY